MGLKTATIPLRTAKTLDKFQNKFTILSNYLLRSTLMQKEKARLRKQRNLIDDFDLLIGATAIANNLTLATRNISDFDRLDVE